MPDDWVTIVSGLPQSGTSLMMQMLQAGGMTLLADERRAADQNNPSDRLAARHAQNRTLYRQRLAS